MSTSFAFSVERTRWLAVDRSGEHDMCAVMRSSFFFRFMVAVTLGEVNPRCYTTYGPRRAGFHFAQSGVANFSSICGAKPVLKHSSVNFKLITGARDRLLRPERHFTRQKPSNGRDFA
jgi:hypothetical protein